MADESISIARVTNEPPPPARDESRQEPSPRQEEHHEAAPSQAELEQKARSMGWQPKDQWKGNPDTWIEAGEFVKRGETFVPFLQHDRKRLKTELDQRDARLAALQEELRQTRESVEALKTFGDQMARERAERRKAELGVALKAAREAGDDVKVAELQNELGEVVKKPETKPAETKPANGAGGPAQPAIQPWVKSFIEGNADFFQSGRKVALFNAVMLEKRQGGDARVGEVDGTALLNEAREEVEKVFGGNARRQAPSKTEETRPSGGGSPGGTGRTYYDLPADARAKCDQQEARFIGRGLFKDQTEWRRHFVGEYFGPSAVGRGGE